jgi:hypothetical protein
MKSIDWVKKERERYKKERTCKCELVAVTKKQPSEIKVRLVCMVCGKILD